MTFYRPSILCSGLVLLAAACHTEQTATQQPDAKTEAMAAEYQSLPQIVVVRVPVDAHGNELHDQAELAETSGVVSADLLENNFEQLAPITNIAQTGDNDLDDSSTQSWMPFPGIGGGGAAQNPYNQMNPNPYNNQYPGQPMPYGGYGQNVLNRGPEFDSIGLPEQTYGAGIFPPGQLPPMAIASGTPSIQVPVRPAHPASGIGLETPPYAGIANSPYMTQYRPTVTSTVVAGGSYQYGRPGCYANNRYRYYVYPRPCCKKTKSCRRW